MGIGVARADRSSEIENMCGWSIVKHTGRCGLTLKNSGEFRLVWEHVVIGRSWVLGRLDRSHNNVLELGQPCDYLVLNSFGKVQNFAVTDRFRLDLSRKVLENIASKPAGNTRLSIGGKVSNAQRFDIQRLIAEHYFTESRRQSYQKFRP